jgi:hypothetical protein
MKHKVTMLLVGSCMAAFDHASGPSNLLLLHACVCLKQHNKLVAMGSASQGQLRIRLAFACLLFCKPHRFLQRPAAPQHRHTLHSLPYEPDNSAGRRSLPRRLQRVHARVWWHKLCHTVWRD